MPEEAVFFGRSGLFGLALAGIYWFLSYEVAGTILLGGFGLATGGAFLLLARAARSARRRVTTAPDEVPSRDVSSSEVPSSEAPFADEGGLVALSSTAPIWVGLGLAVMSLGLGFGFWFVLAGLLPLGLGAATWLAEVRAEADRVEPPV